VEPWGLPQGFWELFRNPRLMPHLHLPLQSGSDPILRRMARRCKRGEFLRLVEEGRRAVPDLNLSTDVIVGFPGEGEAEWGQTMELVEEIGFGHLHIFAFSARPGTRAATLSDRVPAEVIQARSLELHCLGERLRRRTFERFLGRCLPVLMEGADGGDPAAPRIGYTPNFLKVATEHVPSGPMENRIFDVCMEGIGERGDVLLGRLCPDHGGGRPGIAADLRRPTP